MCEGYLGEAQSSSRDWMAFKCEVGASGDFELGPGRTSAVGLGPVRMTLRGGIHVSGPVEKWGRHNDSENGECDSVEGCLCLFVLELNHSAVILLRHTVYPFMLGFAPKRLGPHFTRFSVCIEVAWSVEAGLN